MIDRSVRCEAVNIDLETCARDCDLPLLLQQHFPQHGPYLGVYAQVFRMCICMYTCMTYTHGDRLTHTDLHAFTRPQTHIEDKHRMTRCKLTSGRGSGRHGGRRPCQSSYDLAGAHPELLVDNPVSVREPAICLLKSPSAFN